MEVEDAWDDARDDADAEVAEICVCSPGRHRTQHRRERLTSHLMEAMLIGLLFANKVLESKYKPVV